MPQNDAVFNQKVRGTFLEAAVRTGAVAGDAGMAGTAMTADSTPAMTTAFWIGWIEQIKLL